MKLATVLPVALLALVSCRKVVVIGPEIAAEDGTTYFWATGDDHAERALIRRSPDSAILDTLDEGVFVNVLGPVATEGGIAWATQDESGAWRVEQVGVSDLVARRGQGAGGALEAAWALERVRAGHVPGNAADLGTLAEIARSGEWPRR